MRAFSATEITHSGGSSEPDMNAFAVMPRISPCTCVVTTVTPVTNDAMTRRKRSWVTASSVAGCDSDIDIAEQYEAGWDEARNAAHYADMRIGIGEQRMETIGFNSSLFAIRHLRRSYDFTSLRPVTASRFLK